VPSGKRTVQGLITTLLAVAVMAPAQASASSSSVAALQVGLRAVGLYPHTIDGVTGPQTLRGIRALQRRHHLRADGIAGAHTRRALGRRGRPRLGVRAMRSGERGWDVAALQFLLAKRGFGPGGFDGGFGPQTSLAVRRFQNAAGLGVDGVAGPATLRSLRGRRTFTRVRTRRVSSVAPTGAIRFLRPVSGAEGDGFGFPGGRRHTGIDFPMPFGSRIGAAGRGTVTFAGWNSGGYGNLVVVAHRLGYETWYAHMSRIAVHPGEPVVGGSTLGFVGSTGHSTGPHVHFEVRHYGTPVDPQPYLLSAAAAGVRAKARTGRRLVCRPNADAWGTRDSDPAYARYDHCA
jgi:peptidoglycan hydrolase-like protein with peptidoglycan-binding domain